MPPAMFHDLELFHDPAFAASHNEVLLFTPTQTKRLTVVASRTVAGWEKLNCVRFKDADDFIAWRNETLAATGAAPSDDCKQLITLCSCSYFVNPADERTLVYAS